MALCGDSGARPLIIQRKSQIHVTQMGKGFWRARRPFNRSGDRSNGRTAGGSSASGCTWKPNHSVGADVNGYRSQRGHRQSTIGIAPTGARGAVDRVKSWQRSEWMFRHVRRRRRGAFRGTGSGGFGLVKVLAPGLLEKHTIRAMARTHFHKKRSAKYPAVKTRASARSQRN